jgi:hypothetical protein
MTAEATACGPDAAKHLEQARAYLEAGYDEIYVSNMGPHYQGCMDLWRDEVLPELARG